MQKVSNSLVLFLLSAVAPIAMLAQFEPDGAQVNMYFPQMASGGSSSQHWQTSFIFSNPSTTSTVTATLYLYDDGGNPLSVDFGSGLGSTFTFAIPPQGTRLFRTVEKSTAIVTGWAQAFATLPLQATVLFRYIVNSSPKVEISAQSTLPSSVYRSPAPNKLLGIAVGNVYAQSISVQVSALDSNGNQMASATVPLGPLSHQSFNLYQLLSTLPDTFNGSVVISPVNRADQFVAWTLNADSLGILSSLPPGGSGWPISHWDRIWLVYRKILAAAQGIAPTYGADLTSSPPQLQILPDQVINARGGYNGVTVYLALSELISDSPSELAFVIAHEFGHVIQGRIAGPSGTLTPVFTPVSQTFAGIETDADQWGLILSISAGYDPYAAAGALAKLSMATGTSSLLSQATVDYEFINGQLGSDPHASWGDRIDLLMQTLVATCSNTAYAATCQEYRSVIHPHFPSNEPLSRSPRSKEGKQ